MYACKYTLIERSTTPTRLVAAPAILSLSPLHAYLFDLTATLTRADTGAGIRAASLTFTVSGAPACTATTNAAGVATCSYLTSPLQVVLAGGYRVSFQGTAQAGYATATAGLVD